MKHQHIYILLILIFLINNPQNIFATTFGKNTGSEVNAKLFLNTDFSPKLIDNKGAINLTLNQFNFFINGSWSINKNQHDFNINNFYFDYSQNFRFTIGRFSASRTLARLKNPKINSVDSLKSFSVSSSNIFVSLPSISSSLQNYSVLSQIFINKNYNFSLFYNINDYNNHNFAINSFYNRTFYKSQKKINVTWNFAYYLFQLNNKNQNSWWYDYPYFNCQKFGGFYNAVQNEIIIKNNYLMFFSSIGLNQNPLIDNITKISFAPYFRGEFSIKAPNKISQKFYTNPFLFNFAIFYSPKLYYSLDNSLITEVFSSFINPQFSFKIGKSKSTLINSGFSYFVSIDNQLKDKSFLWQDSIKYGFVIKNPRFSFSNKIELKNFFIHNIQNIINQEPSLHLNLRNIIWSPWDSPFLHYYTLWINYDDSLIKSQSPNILCGIKGNWYPTITNKHYQNIKINLYSSIEFNFKEKLKFVEFSLKGIYKKISLAGSFKLPTKDFKDSINPKYNLDFSYIF